MTGATISLSRIAKRYGDISVLRNIDVDIQAGEFLTLIGPSGCGKSTLLRIIAGLDTQSEGQIAIDGRSIDHLRPKQRNVAMVFQSYALYPHMNVFENMAMPLVMRQMTFMQRFPLFGRIIPGSKSVREGIDAEVEAVARQLHIEMLLKRKPGQLSGGQRQRVALGRAMVRHPRVFLMDEPLSNLDARLRVQMRAELAELHKRLGVTLIYVTHDQVEAMTMSQRIAVMMDGEIVQFGTPDDVYNNPQDLRVAQFIGSPPINVIPGSIDAKGQLSFLDFQRPYFVKTAEKRKVNIGIRPENVRVSNFKVGSTEKGELIARIRHLENLGNEYVAYLDVDREPDLQIVARFSTAHLGILGRTGAAVTLSFPETDLFVFDEHGIRIAGSSLTNSSHEKVS